MRKCSFDAYADHIFHNHFMHNFKLFFPIMLKQHSIFYVSLVHMMIPQK